MSRRPCPHRRIAGVAGALLVLALAACRSVVAPPSGRRDAAALPSGVVSTSPEDLLRPACPRRECPLPANLIAELEERMVGRLDGERRSFLAQFELVRVQRDTWIASLRGILAARRAAAAAAPHDLDAGPDAPDAGPVADPEADAVEPLTSAGAVEVATTLLLEETIRWLEVPLHDDAAAAAEDGGAGDADATPAPAGRASTAGVAPAQAPPVREGEWILPVVKMVARLRAGFTAVAAAQGDLEAVVRTLAVVERRLIEAQASSSSGDLREALEALEAARPAACPARAGSAVCRPPPVEVWTGSEFDRVEPTDRVEVEELLRRIDRLLGPTPDAS